MPQRKVGKIVLSILGVGLLLILSVWVFNQCNTFDFTQKLYENNEIYVRKHWVGSQMKYEEIKISDDVKDEIFKLITSQPYYAWHVEGRREGFTSLGNNLEFISIQIESSSKGTSNRMGYQYEISNTNQIRIYNQNTGKTHHYSLRKFPSSWFDIGGNDIKILYHELQELLQ
ncbi:MAG: hypothetical protein AB9856_01745 [Cellulosilyticaceae bacterium]